LPLRNATLETLDQVMEIIDLVSDHYLAESTISSSPIGRHVRHITDHLLAFQSGISSGCIDYNLRRRDTAFEYDPAFAKKTLANFTHWLKSAPLDKQTVTVVSEISVSHSESAKLTSTLDRELMFQINHTLHHVAYIRAIAKSLGLDIPAYLGVAPATASYLRERESSQCAQ